MSASENLTEAVSQPQDLRNIRYVRNINGIFDAARAEANARGAGVAMIVADHHGTTLRMETTEGGQSSRGVAAGKIAALMHNDLDNSRLCQRSLCVAGALASYAFTGRAGLQGAVMFQYFVPGEGMQTGFFSVSGSPDMWDDVLIAKHGLEGAGYSLVNGRNDVYGMGVAHHANNVRDTAQGFQGSR